MSDATIEMIRGREVLDSRGDPTVAVDVYLAGGAVGTAMVPSGASTGAHEAVELRDGDRARYGGKGVLKAVGHLHDVIAPQLIRAQATDQAALDSLLRELRGTPGQAGADCAGGRDPVATELFAKGQYALAREKATLDSAGMIAQDAAWRAKSPIVSIEDGLAEDDWDGWKALTKALGERVQLVGDDLFVTNVERIRRGVTEGAANAVPLKLNHIGRP